TTDGELIPVFFNEGLLKNTILDVSIEGKTVWVATNFGVIRLTNRAQPHSAITAACNDRVFVRVEVLPSLKNEAEFNDSVTTYLKSKNVFRNKMHMELEALVSKEGKLLDVKKKNDKTVLNSEIIDALYQFENMWKCGTQNSRPVCAYVKIKIDIDGDAL